MAMGKYIVVEGPDGVGKTAVAAALRDRLLDEGVHSFKMPSPHHPVGKLIHAVFRNDVSISSKAMMHLFNADAVDQDQHICKALDNGWRVVLDRHTRISGCVYQVEYHELSTIMSSTPASAYRSIDVCILLDAPSRVLAERIASRNGEKVTDNLYTSTNLDRLDTLRERYGRSPHLHPDLVERWLHFDTNKNSPQVIASSVLRELSIG